MKEYNIHCFLYDVLHIGTHHFKNKWLCKHNKHNYQLHTSVDYIPEVVCEYSPDGRSIVSKCEGYKKVLTTYYKCYCCGKEINLGEKEVKLNETRNI